MILYQYTYKDFEDIITLTGKILEQSPWATMIIIFSTLTLLILFFIILPLTIVSLKERKIQSEKQKKKNLLTEILLKKELEDEIEKELTIDNKSNISNL